MGIILVFKSGELTEDEIEGGDEMHFVFEINNRNLASKGDNKISYAEFVSGRDPITIMMRLIGSTNAAVHSPILIF